MTMQLLMLAAICSYDIPIFIIQFISKFLCYNDICRLLYILVITVHFNMKAI